MAESKELATNGKIELPTVGINAKQYGVDLDASDRTISRLTLVQPTSKVEGAGKFYFSLTGELFDQVECVVFSNQRGRVMFDPDLSKQMTICGSSDRVTPQERFEPPYGHTRCVECPFANRNYHEEIIIGSKKVQKYCSETQALKAMFVDSLLPFIFVGRRTSITPVNDFLSYMEYECAKARSPLCFFPIKITSFQGGKTGEKYYIPKIERLGRIERAEFVTMMNKYSNYDVDETFKAEEAKAGAADGEPVPF